MGGGGSHSSWPTGPSQKVTKKKAGSGGGIGGDGGDPCDISFVTVINSQVETVVSKLKVGDILDVVVLKETTGPRLVVQKDKKLAGVISHGLAIAVIDCITEKNSYEAEITEKKNLHCKILVRRK